MSSFTERVTEVVLNSCRTIDSGATIASILRDSCGRTVVRVRASDSSDSGTPIKLLGAMKRLWPLATTSVLENALDSIIEAEIVIPTIEDERLQATRWASDGRVLGYARAVSVVLLVIGTLLYLMDANAARDAFENSTRWEL